MKAMYKRNMSMCADASWYAPVCQSAQCTSASTRALILDTALLAVSFLFDVLLGIISLAVRIILPRQAKP